MRAGNKKTVNKNAINTPRAEKIPRFDTGKIGAPAKESSPAAVVKVVRSMGSPV